MEVAAGRDELSFLKNALSIADQGEALFVS
jgi:hypothetical protein